MGMPMVLKNKAAVAPTAVFVKNGYCIGINGSAQGFINHGLVTLTRGIGTDAQGLDHIVIEHLLAWSATTLAMPALRRLESRHRTKPVPCNCPEIGSHRDN